MSVRINPDKRNVINRYILYLAKNRKYLTPKKLWNMSFIKIQKNRIPQRVLGLPYKWALEPTNICDSRCALCPIGEGFVSRPKGMMKFDDYKTIIDRYKDYIYFLGLYNWGEPLVHPDIYKMITYASQKGIYTELSTNLHNFKNDDVGVLIKSGLDEIGISMHGISRDSYQKYQRAYSFDKVVEKIENIYTHKKSLRFNKPRLRIVFVVNKYNEHEIEKLPYFAFQFDAKYSLLDASLNIRYIGFDKNFNPLNLSDIAIEQRIKSRFDEWLPKKQQYINRYYAKVRENYSFRKNMAGNKIFQCRAPWDSIVVSWDGDVNLCCGIYRKENALGNIFEEDLEDIWNNSKYQASRLAVKNGENGMQTENSSVCTHCPGMLL